MKKIINKFFILFCFLVILCYFIFTTPKAIEYDEQSFLNDAKSGCLIECKSGTVIYSKNDTERLAPASMTKIMTMILVMEKLYDGSISYNDLVVTPKDAANLGGSQIYLSEGEQMSVHDLLKAMCIASANDAAMSLAIYIGGSEKMFVNMMNKKVEQLGLTNTNFVNPYGFDDPNHYTSSYDMACMASHLINNYPKILQYTSIYEDYVREDTEKRFWLVNTNKLVKFEEGVDGLKTGWTNNSGYCLTATMSKNNERFIAVAMGCSTPSIRNKEICELLHYGINNYETVTLIEKDQVIKEINDINYNPNKIILTATDNVVILKKKNEQLKDYKIIENIDLLNNKYSIDIYYNNKLYQKVQLLSSVQVKKASIWDLFLEVIKQLFLS